MTEFGDRNLHHGSTSKMFSFAKDQRRNMTEAETVMWKALRNKKLNGFKIRRQHPIGSYIADFYCHDVRLVIEIDGEIHDSVESKSNDEDRSMVLKELGIQVIRFTNFEIIHHLNEVLVKIYAEIEKLLKEQRG
jgi:very-short-patch-repair endonuclease